jgi:hypothetical protein
MKYLTKNAIFDVIMNKLRLIGNFFAFCFFKSKINQPYIIAASALVLKCRIIKI